MRQSTWRRGPTPPHTALKASRTTSARRDHGPAVTNPRQYVRHLIGHRMQREKQILRLVGEQPREIPDIVANAYPGLDPRLVAAAGGSVLAHLLDLERRGLVERQEQQWKAA